ncbi:MAG TPA: alpha amylase C-terminal domain-containing protein [Bacteroidales bacterium]|nr:alpha amylase C-terminal domain-containing protein [Bacteroidales bacterium]
MGDGALCFAVLAATIPDIPLVYTGQEAGLNKRLKFFEKDTINWGNYSLTSFYQKLIGLKKRNNALRNGDGGRPVFLSTGRDSAVVAFVRKGDDDKILVLCNLSPLPQAIVIKNDLLPGEYNEVFTGNLVRLKRKWALSMKPWEYMVFELVEKK